MIIAFAAKQFEAVSGYAGQGREWLLYDCVPRQPIPEPNRVTLNKDQVLHHFKDHDPHPLDGVEIVVVGSAGDGLGFFEGC